MPPRSLPSTGPLADAARAACPAAFEGPLERLTATRFLPTCIDLAGSVVLSGVLEPGSAGRWAEVSSHFDLLTRVEREIAAVAEKMKGVFRGQVRVSSPTLMLRSLKNAGPAFGEEPSGLREIRPPFGRHLQGHFQSARQSVITLRVELLPHMAAASSTSSRLLALDAALHEAAEAHVELLIARLLTQTERALNDRAIPAIRALPERYTLADLEPWFAPGGWVPAHLRVVGKVVQAIWSHESGRLRALVRAATEGSSS
jgi:hypothetical protein